MISKESTVKKIQKEISSQKYDEAIKLIEHNKRNLVEIDYWYYLSLCSRYSKKYNEALIILNNVCLLYTSPSPRDLWISRMPSSA